MHHTKVKITVMSLFLPITPSDDVVLHFWFLMSALYGIGFCIIVMATASYPVFVCVSELVILSHISSNLIGRNLTCAVAGRQPIGK